MRTDPRKACANARERFWWALLHDAVAHPLMGLTNWSSWAVRFHDWTSRYAWPRAVPQQDWAPEPSAINPLVVEYWPSGFHGALECREIADGIWSVQHPMIRHAIRVQAQHVRQAAFKAEAWFLTLADVGIHPPYLSPQ
jgi:hypothetical protein